MNTGVILILTATIDPGQVVKTAVVDPARRLEEYNQSLNWWLNTAKGGWIEQIFFVENSGADLFPLQYRLKYDQRTQVTFVQNDDNRYCWQRGKGYGEVRMIEFQRQVHGAEISKASLVIKVSGRTIVRNIKKLFDTNSVDAMTHSFAPRSSSYVDTRLFALRPRLFMEMFDGNLSDEIDDSLGRYFEYVFAEQVQKAVIKGYFVGSISTNP